MILIVSHNSLDEPTNDVMDWLSFYNSNFKRINGDEFDYSNEYLIDFDNLAIKNDNNEIKEKDIDIIWYRRWINRPQATIINEFKANDFDQAEGYFLEAYVSYLRSEISSISPSLFSLFHQKKWVPDYKLSRGQLNKMETLLNAKKAGIKVPRSILTTSKKEVSAFYNNIGDLITKSIKDADLLSFRGEEIDLYTKVITSKEIEDFPDFFFPTLFQEKIEKEFELRVFFIHDNYFAMAIFSQNDETTSVDFRNYNRAKPNRYIPFDLPADLQSRIKKLMKIIGLNTGSIDLLVSRDKEEYYFLEVNPVGQIGMVSNNCNYNIEQTIAKTLIRNERKRT